MFRNLNVAMLVGENGHLRGFLSVDGAKPTPKRLQQKFRFTLLLLNRVLQEWMFGVLDILIFEEKKSLYKYI